MPWSILDIDADHAARHRRFSTLQNTGWTLLQASSRAEAERFLSTNDPDVLLLSILPTGGLDLAFCRELKSNIETASAIIVISPDGSAISYAEALKAGADAWLTEPVNASQLIETVEALMARPQHRQQRNSAARESLEDYRSLVQHAPVGLYRTTPDGHILMANPALVSMLGFESFEVFEHSDLNAVQFGPGYSRDWFRHQLESEGRIAGLETTWTRRDGTTIMVRESASAVRGPDGTVRFYDGSIEDFTARKRVEDSLRDSEEQFRAMFDQASIGVVRATLDGNFLLVNDGFCEITGYSRVELLTMNYRDITHPDDLDAGVDFRQRVLQGGGKPFLLEKRYIRKDDSLAYVRLFISLLRRKDGSPHSTFAFVEDVTARKQAEQALQRELEFDKLIADLLTRLATCSGPEIDSTVVETLRAVAGHCGGDHAYVTQPSNRPFEKHSRVTHEWCEPHVTPQMPQAQAITAADFPWSCRKTLANEVVALDRLDRLPPEADIDRTRLEQEGALALLHVPIKGRKEQIVGCIGLHQHQHPKEWTSADIARLRIVGNAISAILERQRAEDCLRDSEAKFAAVFRTSSEAIVISSVSDQKIVDANPTFFNLSGYTREEVLGKTTAQLDFNMNAADGTRTWSHLLEKGIVPDLDVTVRTKTGALRTGIASRVLVKVQEQQYAVNMFRDLTWRMQAEQALRRQAVFDRDGLYFMREFIRSPASEFERILAGALRTIAAFFGADHVLILKVAPETRIWEITREWCAPHVKALGPHGGSWTLETMFSDVDVRFDVEQVDPATGFNVDAHRNEGATFVMNVPVRGVHGTITHRISLHRHGDRTPWTAEDAGRLRLVGNTLAGILERHQAEQALRKSEQDLRDFADSAPVMTWISGADGRGVFFSNQTLSFAGRPMEKLIDRGWVEILHDEERERFVNAYDAAIKSRTPFSLEARFLRADGEWRWLLASGVPRFVNGAYNGHIGTVVDITDLKHTLQQHMASQKLESLGVLAAGVAHDFNNLLASIISHADCAQSDIETGSPAAVHVDEITKIGLRAAGIVSQLIMFTSQETEPFKSIDLPRLVAEISSLMKASISKTTTLETDLPADLPAVRANVTEMRQLIMNLVINASEALQNQPGFIQIKARRAQVGPSSKTGLPEGDYVQLEVSDTGCGMNEETKAKIFDPFFSTKFIGRGLGLSVVQGIIRRHNGIIEVQSAPGKGTCLSIFLPCTSQFSNLNLS